MYRFGVICFDVNSILVKSVPCAQRPNESATAAIAVIDNCHAGFMTWLLVRGFAGPIVICLNGKVAVPWGHTRIFTGVRRSACIVSRLVDSRALEHRRTC